MRTLPVIRTLLFHMILLMASCEEKTYLPAGLSVENGSEIKTFAGDNVTLKLTVSDEVGIEKIILDCKNWHILKEYDLSGQKPVVFNISYPFIVPETAGMNFSEKMKVDVVNVGGIHTIREIPLNYLPDNTLPELINYNPELEITYEEGSGVFSGSFNLADDRGLKSVRLEIDEISFDETKTLKGKTATYTPALTFTSIANYNATLTITDISDNSREYAITFIVMVTEVENPISDYPGMFIVNTGESPANYIVGYYQPLQRTNPYEYWGYFYAPENNTKIAFVPTQSLDGDYFGVSPYVSTKLFNNNGYVVPINIAAKGYYSIWIDIQNQVYTVTAYTPAAPAEFAGLAGSICMVGTGYTYGDWVMSPAMTYEASNDLRISGNLSVALDAGGTVSLCFSTPDWAHIWRPDKDSPSQVTGWWHSPGGIMFYFESVGAGNYPVTFDAGISPIWVTIRKP